MDKLYLVWENEGLYPEDANDAVTHITRNLERAKELVLEKGYILVSDSEGVLNYQHPTEKGDYRHWFAYIEEKEITE